MNYKVYWTMKNVDTMEHSGIRRPEYAFTQ